MRIPVLKLGTLALRTLSKPIAHRLKHGAGLHPKFRDSIINLAQANHRFSTIMQRRIYGHSTDVLIRPLDKGKAVQAAADILGELFIFTVAGAAIIYETHRSYRKEEKQRREMEALKERGNALEQEVQLLRQKLQEMEEVSKRRTSSFDFFSFWHTPAFQDPQSSKSF